VIQPPVHEPGCDLAGHRDQAGFSLIEILVSIALIGVMVSALTAGIITTMRASSTANSISRATALLTSARATVAQLNYIECGSGELVQRYNQALQQHNQNLPEADKLIPTDAVGMSASVIAVNTVGGCEADALDAGQQKLTISVTVRGVSLDGFQVKRGEPLLLRPVITPQYLNPGSGDPIGIFLLSAINSVPLSEIDRFDWDCGNGNGTTPSTRYTTNDPSDPDIECRYPAQVGTNTEYTVTLTVTDIRQKVATTTRVVTVDPSGADVPDAVASFTATPASGNVPLVVTLDPDGSRPGTAEGALVKYEWDFGDSYDPENRYVTTTSITEKPFYTYTRAGTFNARLTITDDIGRRSSTTRTVVATQPGLARPTAAFSATPSGGVSPQTVEFDASNSLPGDPGRPILSWQWDFDDSDDSALAFGEIKSHQFNSPRAYVVRLTVRDGDGLEDTTTRLVKLDNFTNPVDFRLTTVKPAPGDGIFYFSWTNEGASPSDSLRYEIKIEGLVGCTGFGTQTHTFDAGPPGTTQNGAWVVPGPGSNVCLGSQYQWSMRSVRNNPIDGTFPTDPYDMWTDWLWFKARTNPY